VAEAARATVSELRTQDAWQGFLGLELRRPVRVTFTRSRKTPVQVRPLRAARDGIEVRLHGLFAGAPPEVGAALVSWIRSGRRAPRACARLDAYIAEVLRRLPPPSPRHALVASGRCHDLERLCAGLFVAELAPEFADPARRPRVSWGRRGPSRTRRSLRLGSYDPDAHLVRIHPVLDQPAVPEWFVRYVVFHELLHAVLPPVRGADDRWVHHGREFRARERRYADYRRALEWERRHLTALVRSARTGTELAPVEAQARPPRPASDARGVLRVLQGWLFPAG
jgi:hypothetical protein